MHNQIFLKKEFSLSSSGHELIMILIYDTFAYPGQFYSSSCLHRPIHIFGNFISLCDDNTCESTIFFERLIDWFLNPKLLFAGLYVGFQSRNQLQNTQSLRFWWYTSVIFSYLLSPLLWNIRLIIQKRSFCDDFFLVFFSINSWPW